MSKCSGSETIRLIIIFLLVITYYIIGYNEIYKGIKATEVVASTIEYGSANYDIKDLIKTNGKIVSVKNDVDLYNVGVQEVVLVVAKGSIEKEVSVDVEVKDTVEPTIVLKEEAVTIVQGEEFDLTSNVESVSDVVDGSLEYKSEKEKGFYTIESNFNKNVVGTYDVLVTAVDKNGNEKELSYQVNVLERGLSNDIVRVATSLIGTPYMYGGSSPAGFDCSGFVQYVYRQNGISVSRSAPTQLMDGRSVSYEDMLPGDILVWGYDENSITHTAIYIGDGKMVHSTHPGEGVLVSSIDFWRRGSGTDIISIRRID